MSDEQPTSLSDELAARVREIDSLKERLRSSEEGAGKVGALESAIEDKDRKLEALRGEKQRLSDELSAAQSEVSRLETEARASGEDAKQIEALEAQLTEARDEVEKAKEHAQGQTDAFNALSTEHLDLQEQLRKAQGAETAARHFKDFLDYIENVE